MEEERQQTTLGRVVTITSGKGGVGKTTATANIGAALAAMGKSVALVDADIGLRNLDIVLGLENRIVYDLVDVVKGTCRLPQAMTRNKSLNNLSLIPAAQTREKDAVSPQQMKTLCEELRRQFDFTLIDSRPLPRVRGAQSSSRASPWVAGAAKTCRWIDLVTCVPL